MATKKRSAKKVARSKKAKRTTAETVGAVDKDLLKQLDGRKGVTGGMWKPEAIGDTLVGQILSMRAEKSKFDNMQVVLIVGTPDGARTVYANWSLQQGLINERVDVGDTIGIRYTEDVPGRGRPMRAFAVVRKGGKGKAKTLNEALTKAMESDKKGKRKRR
jgi:hypothetical protein